MYFEVLPIPASFARGLLRATMNLIVIKKTLTYHAMTANEHMEFDKAVSG